MNVVDLFCGAGLFSEGFRMAGFQIILGTDIDLDSLKSFKANHEKAKIIHKNVKFLRREEIIKEIGNQRIDVVLGGVPCQGFSLANKKRFIDDPRNILYKEFVRLVHDLNPMWFVMENVPQMLTLGNIGSQVMSDFKGIGYQVKCKVLCAADYGVPQLRHRVFFIGNNVGLQTDFPSPTHEEKPQATLFGSPLKPYVTVGDVLDLDHTNGVPLRKDQMKRVIGSGQRLRHVDRDKPSPTIMTEIGDKRAGNVHPYIIRWKEGFNPPPAIVKLLEKGKLNIATWDKPSTTVLAATGGWNLDGAYLLDGLELRPLTWKECAILQSIPEECKFFGNKQSKHRQIGNAVPPLLAMAIAQKIMELTGHG